MYGLDIDRGPARARFALPKGIFSTAEGSAKKLKRKYSIISSGWHFDQVLSFDWFGDAFAASDVAEVDHIKVRAIGSVEALGGKEIQGARFA